jgi:hypothetical protein
VGESAGSAGDRFGVAEDFVAEARTSLELAASLVRHAVGQLGDEQVWRRPRDGMNSIGNLMLHLAGNLRQRFGSVIGGEPDDRDRHGEFTERGPIPRDELLRRFEEAARLADEILAGLTPARLAETCRYELFSGPAEKPVLGVVLQALTHLHGHAQEILHLARLHLGERYAFRQPEGVPPELRGGA